MTSKIRIKIGALEVDYEGTEQYLKEDLPALLAEMADLYKATGATVDANGGAPMGGSGGSSAVGGEGGSGSVPTLTTGSIAAKLGVSSGPDLAIAAAARMNLVEKRDTFTRQQLLTEMKTANAYYKTSMSDNLTKHIQSLVKQGKLVESAKNVFSLAAATRTEVTAKLA